MRTPLLVLLIAMAALSACSGKKSSSGGGTASPQHAPSWVTDPPSTSTTLLSLVDTSTPTYVIGTGSAASVTAAELQAKISLGGIITFDTGGQDVTLTLSAQLEIPQQKTVVIDGGGHVTLDGNHAVRIIHKQWQSDLTVQRLHFVNGDATSYTGTGDTLRSGGAINVDTWDGYLTVIQCTFDSCTAVQTGPDCGGGAIRAPGQRQLRVSDCTFTNCSGSNGGALSSLGSQLTVLGCTFTNNHAVGVGSGGAIYVDGVYQNSDAHQLTLDGCTFTGNTGHGHGGAMFAIVYQNTGSLIDITSCTFANNVQDSSSGTAGAIYLQDGDVTIANTTFTGNSTASIAGALRLYDSEVARVVDCTITGNQSASMGGAMDLASSNVYLQSCTIADNSGGWWPGGVLFAQGNPNVWMKNCILANNVVTTITTETTYNGWNVAWPVQDGGGNLQWPRQRGSTGVDDTPATTGILFVDPQLQPLGANGGPTQTRAIPDASPAHNGGTDADCPARDQRGLPRVNRCDIGAYEIQTSLAANG
jgi:predicted outer membrane repeat protein